MSASHFWIAGLVVSLVAATGCSKKEEAAAVAEPPPAGESTAEIANPAEAAVVAQDTVEAVPLTSGESAVAAGNYDAAAAAVVRAQYGGTLTDQQREQIQQIQQAMLNAGQKDPRALEAYKGMSRALNGR